MSQEFTKMMLGEDYEITEEMGDIEHYKVFLNSCKNKMCHFSLEALEKGTVEKKVRQKGQQRLIVMFLNDITGKQ